MVRLIGTVLALDALALGTARDAGLVALAVSKARDGEGFDISSSFNDFAWHSLKCALLLPNTHTHTCPPSRTDLFWHSLFLQWHPLLENAAAAGPELACA
jgi:hypothetical protein